MIRARESKAAPVQVVGKLLRVLEALNSSSTGLQLREIAQQTRIHKSTAYRFLAHLENAGYLFREDGGAYIIGPRLAQLGAGIAYYSTLRMVSRPALQELWRTTKETVTLAVADGFDVLYLDVIESSHAFRVGSQVGVRRPLNCTALGIAVLAFLPPEQREDTLASLTFNRVTSHSITDSVRFRRELAKVFRQGYALDDQETDLGARCVAAAILDGDGRVPAALSVSGPITRITRGEIPKFATSVKNAAKDISSRLNRFQ